MSSTSSNSTLSSSSTVSSSSTDSSLTSSSTQSLYNLCVIVKPHAINFVPDILHEISQKGWTVQKFSKCRLSIDFVKSFYAQHVDKWFFDRLRCSMTYSDVFCMMVYAPISEVRSWIGPTDPEEARTKYPDSLRARFGIQLPNNVIHASDSVEEANRELGVCTRHLIWSNTKSNTNPKSTTVKS